MFTNWQKSYQIMPERKPQILFSQFSVKILFELAIDPHGHTQTIYPLVCAPVDKVFVCVRLCVSSEHSERVAKRIVMKRLGRGQLTY
jgi:hypothetical protein